MSLYVLLYPNNLQYSSAANKAISDFTSTNSVKQMVFMYNYIKRMKLKYAMTVKIHLPFAIIVSTVFVNYVCRKPHIEDSNGMWNAAPSVWGAT